MTERMRLIAGRYRLVDCVGRGGMADVYRAIDEVADRLVAVKLVRSGDPELARRVVREVDVLRRLDHPGLVRLHDSGVADGQTYLVMELVDGGTLEDRLRQGPLPPAEVAALVSTLALGLAHVHGAGVVHRDVKPGNVLLDRQGRAYLTDFGIAHLVDDASVTSTGMTVGTAGYMAPEQLAGRPAGPPADVWSLGVVALECLRGGRVYQGTVAEVVAQRMAGPPAIPDDLPGSWRSLLSRMLQGRPEQRPSAADVAARTGSRQFGAPGVDGRRAALRLVGRPPADAAVAGAGAGAVAGLARSGAVVDAGTIHAGPVLAPADEGSSATAVHRVPPGGRRLPTRQRRRRAVLVASGSIAAAAAAVALVAGSPGTARARTDVDRAGTAAHHAVASSATSAMAPPVTSAGAASTVDALTAPGTPPADPPGNQASSDAGPAAAPTSAGPSGAPAPAAPSTSTGSTVTPTPATGPTSTSGPSTGTAPGATGTDGGGGDSGSGTPADGSSGTGSGSSGSGTGSGSSGSAAGSGSASSASGSGPAGSVSAPSGSGSSGSGAAGSSPGTTTATDSTSES